jgi:glycosyltransferase involved in cell wall biosynthesis
MSKYIIVNATALKKSGALTILEQFIEEIPFGKYDYIIFTNSSIVVSSSRKNIRIIPKSIKNFRQRIIWDSFGIKIWLRSNKIRPAATLSLQNTNFRTNSLIPNFVYFHNAIPLSAGNWNPFRNNERELWFYKCVYPFFIRLYLNSKTEVFVQTKSIGESFSKNFNIPMDRIHIVLPGISIDKSKKTSNLKLDPGRLNLFYPATSFIFKNHLTIIKAISLLDVAMQEKITLHLTCKEHDLPFKINNSSIGFHINFMDNIAFGMVLQLYEEADALLFPSYIETLGLPLIEAASFGMPVIASDLPYAREALTNYSGVKFIKYNDVSLWRKEISGLFELKGHRFTPQELDQSGSWIKMFRIMEDKIL